MTPGSGLPAAGAGGAASRRLDAPWLREGALPRLLAVLDREGEEARIVGGAVRNALLEEPVEDFDIATTALPEEVARRAAAAGFRTVPTGVEHGTLTVIVAGAPFEVTTLREDVETFGRHATVAFGRDWRRDAERRDFTMNALSLARDGAIHDYVGGLADLDARRVRFIGDPATRIAEDYLRILRFFRFHAAYGHGSAPDAAGLHACIVGREGLDTLSRERVGMEMRKLLVARHAAASLTAMAEAGLLGRVLGGVPLAAGFARMVQLEAALALSADPERRLGALAVLVGEDAERLRQRLRLSNPESDRLLSMADGWWRVASSMEEQAAKAMLYRLKSERYLDRILLAWSRAAEGVADGSWRALATLPARWPVPVFPLRSSEFVARGIDRGPALGAAMRAAEAAWIAAGFPSDPDKIAAIADVAAKASIGSAGSG